MFEHLNRSLICWLDGKIAEGEQIRRIQKLVTVFNNNGESRFGDNIKTEREIFAL